MDLERTYKNSRLEARRKQLLNAQHLAAVLRNNKRSKRDAIDDVLDVFERPSALKTPRARAILKAIKSFGRRWQSEERDALRRLFTTLAEQTRLLDVDRDLPDRLRATIAMASECRFWIRQPSEWSCRTHNAGRQLAQLSRHLFARYEVPAWLDQAWFALPQKKTGRGRVAWFIFVGQGGNLRKAYGLPIPLTKMMAHHAMQAPAGVTIEQALRFGQAIALGVEPAAVHALLGSRLGRSFGNEPQEAFWLSVMSFLARHPMIDPQQIGPICDYLHEQKFVPVGVTMVAGVFEPGPARQPGLSMAGRDPTTLIAQVQQWHRGLARARAKGAFSGITWLPSGVPALARIEGVHPNARRFEVIELLSGTELRDEGAAMRHCVATYTWACQQQRSAIFSVRADGERLLTVEVDLRARSVVQVRGRLNTPPTPLGERIVRLWATHAQLHVGAYAFPSRT